MAPTLSAVRSRPARTFAAAALGALAAPAAAQSWSDAYHRPGLPGRVFALGEYQGELIAGGLPLTGDVVFPGNVARFDGERWLGLGQGVKGDDVRAITVFEGDLVVAGEFTSAGGQPVGSVARWDGAQWLPLGQGLELGFSTGRAFSLAVYQGDLYAGGYFSQAGGTSVSGVARWDGGQWHDLGGGVSGFEATVHALLPAPDGNLYVGGEFDAAGGLAGTECIAAWDGTSWSSVGGGFPAPLNAGVWDLAWFDGRLWAGGNMEVPGGATQEKLGIWDGAAWTPAGVFPDSGIHNLIYALEPFGGDLYVAGNITSVDGVDVDRIARWNGSAWESIGGVGLGATTLIMDMHVHDAELVVGGELDRAGAGLFAPDAFCTESVASFDGSEWGNVGHGFGGTAPAGAVLWNGELVAVGGGGCSGSVLGGDVVVQGVDDWMRLADTNGSVSAAAVFGGDLVVAGDFTAIEGVPAANVARFDGSQWQPLGTGAAATGEVLAVYQGELYLGGPGTLERLQGSVWQAVGGDPFGPFDFVEELAVFGGSLYVGGQFSNSGGHLYAWDGASLSLVGGGLDGPVNGLAVHGGTLVVGGDFSSAGGIAVHDLARWDGASFSPFPGLTGTRVAELGLFQGDLVAGGNLFVPGLPPSKYLARWDGAAWQAFDGGTNADGTVFVADESNGRLFLGGLFTQVDSLPSQSGGLPSWNVGAWQTHCQPSLGFGGPGSSVLSVCGDELTGSGDAQVRLEGAPPATLAFLAIGAQPNPTPLLGGTVVPIPTSAIVTATTDATGTVVLPIEGGAPATAVLQFVVLDLALPDLFRISNAVQVELLP